MRLDRDDISIKRGLTVAKSSSPRTLGFGGTTCVDDSHVVLGSLFLSDLIAYHDIMLFFKFIDTND